MADSDGARLWVRIDIDGKGRIGPGKIALLKAVASERSIAAAARALSMSYRRAWLLIDEMNGLGAGPVVATTVGGSAHGGASLTPRGEEIVGLYEAAHAQAEAATATERARLATLAGGRSVRGE
ncbi:MAG: LysR family transcriptional regulator [Alphaproteobacteria bacterium]|nr:LysR family transcriptional regulator [Alphaproteobacteria bacterium]